MLLVTILLSGFPFYSAKVLDSTLVKSCDYSKCLGANSENSFPKKFCGAFDQWNNVLFVLRDVKKNTLIK